MWIQLCVALVYVIGAMALVTPKDCQSEPYYCTDNEPRAVRRDDFHNIVALTTTYQLTQYRFITLPTETKLEWIDYQGYNFKWLTRADFSDAPWHACKTAMLGRARIVACPDHDPFWPHSGTECTVGAYVVFAFGSEYESCHNFGGWLPPRHFGVHHASNHNEVQACPICARNGRCDDGVAGHGCCSYPGYPPCQCDDGFTDTATGCHKICPLLHQKCPDEWNDQGPQPSPTFTSMGGPCVLKGTSVNRFGDREPFQCGCQQGWHGTYCNETCTDAQHQPTPLCNLNGFCFPRLSGHVESTDVWGQPTRQDNWTFHCICFDDVTDHDCEKG